MFHNIFCDAFTEIKKNSVIRMKFMMFNRSYSCSKILHRENSDVFNWVENVLKTTFFELKMFSMWLNQVGFVLKISFYQYCSQNKNKMWFLNQIQFVLKNPIISNALKVRTERSKNRTKSELHFDLKWLVAYFL